MWYTFWLWEATPDVQRFFYYKRRAQESTNINHWPYTQPAKVGDLDQLWYWPVWSSQEAGLQTGKTGDLSTSPSEGRKKNLNSIKEIAPAISDSKVLVLKPYVDHCRRCLEPSLFYSSYVEQEQTGNLSH
jgi:hypothetical protein